MSGEQLRCRDPNPSFGRSDRPLPRPEESPKLRESRPCPCHGFVLEEGVMKQWPRNGRWILETMPEGMGRQGSIGQ